MYTKEAVWGSTYTSSSAPFSTYPHAWVPTGHAGTAASLNTFIGMSSTGFSNDYAQVMTNIDLGASGETRIGSSIFIKRITVHIKVRRVIATLLQAPNQSQHFRRHHDPFFTCVLLREPIPGVFPQTNTNASAFLYRASAGFPASTFTYGNSGLWDTIGEPARVVRTTATSTMDINEMTDGQATAIAAPGVKSYFDVEVVHRDHLRTDHLQPVILSLTSTAANPAADQVFAGTVVGGAAPNFTFSPTLAAVVESNRTAPTEEKLFEIRHEKRYDGRGLLVNYDQTDVTPGTGGLRAQVNPIWLIFNFDDTGFLFQAVNLAVDPVVVTAEALQGYQDEIWWRAFVEFEDAPQEASK